MQAGEQFCPSPPVLTLHPSQAPHMTLHFWLHPGVSCLPSPSSLAALPTEGIAAVTLPAEGVPCRGDAAVPSAVGRAQLPVATAQEGHCDHREDIPDAVLLGPGEALHVGRGPTCLASAVPCWCVTGISHCFDRSLGVARSIRVSSLQPTSTTLSLKQNS